KALAGEGVIGGVDDLVVHRAAMLRMRMQHQRDRRVGQGPVLVAAFEAPLGAVHDYIWHGLNRYLGAGAGITYYSVGTSRNRPATIARLNLTNFVGHTIWVSHTCRPRKIRAGRDRG